MMALSHVERAGDVRRDGLVGLLELDGILAQRLALLRCGALHDFVEVMAAHLKI